MKKSELAQLVKTSALVGNGLLEFIDGLRERGVMIFPKFSTEFRLVSLRFGPDAQHTLTSGECDINYLMSRGPIYRSITHHNPVLLEISKAHAAGEPQPRALDEAGEVLLGHAQAPGRDQLSPVIYGVIERANEYPDRAGAIPAILDYWSPMQRGTLLAAVAGRSSDLPSDLQVSAICLMPEIHGNAALRWICRGLDADVAVARQEAIMSRLPVPSDGPTP